MIYVSCWFNWNMSTWLRVLLFVSNSRMWLVCWVGSQKCASFEPLVQIQTLSRDCGVGLSQNTFWSIHVFAMYVILLRRQSADMAVAPITVTARRLEVVDFTDPFLQLGISMLMRQPDRATSSSLTSFLWPLSGSVWMYSAFATIGTALSVIIVSLISPAESADEFNVTVRFRL